MSLTSRSPAPPSIVTRLRAAGCVFAEDEARLLVSAARTPAELDAMVDRRVAGLPLEHVLGWADFCGLRLAVEPGVFVPRPRTAFLLRQAVALARPGMVVADVCCGSGAIGAALAAAVGPITLHAVDVDPAAVACARRNLAAAGGRVYEGDLYAPLPGDLRGRVDLIVASPPYVPTDAIGLLPPRRGTTSRRSPSTAARTGSTSYGGSSRRPPAGSRPAANCWWRPAGARPGRPPRPSPAPGSRRA